MCKALEISRSGYYAHRTKPARKRRREDRELKSKIRRSFKDGRGVHGSPRIRTALAREGVRCGKNRIARLMREEGLRVTGKRRWRPPRTTDSRHGLPIAPNLLKQIPTPAAPDQAWVSDITYLPTDEGWHYLAVIMDLCSRRVVGWATDPSLQTGLVKEALQRAIAARGRPAGLIHHSDRGCQYASTQYRDALRDAGLTQSMSRKGNCYDNAAMESFFASLKAETFQRHTAQTRRQAELILFDYIETFCNPKRFHSALGNRSPLEFESELPQTKTTSTTLSTCSEKDHSERRKRG